MVQYYKLSFLLKKTRHLAFFSPKITYSLKGAQNPITSHTPNYVDKATKICQKFPYEAL